MDKRTGQLSVCVRAHARARVCVCGEVRGVYVGAMGCYDNVARPSGVAVLLQALAAWSARETGALAAASAPCIVPRSSHPWQRQPGNPGPSLLRAAPEVPPVADEEV